MASDNDFTVLRDAALIDLDTPASRRRIGRAQNFSVEWIDSTQPHAARSAHELLLLLPGAGAHIEYEGAGPTRQGVRYASFRREPARSRWMPRVPAS